MRLSRSAARHMLLASQGLLRAPRKRTTKADVLECIRRMGALQIDTINVIARSPYLVLWSRLGQYDPGFLDQLLAEGALFEGWSHAASFLPMETYPLYRPFMGDAWRHATKWIENHPDAIETVRNHVRQQGEVRSIEFKRTDGKSGTWWSWKPEKLALECLFITGELMIARRDRFQRVYARREDVLPCTEWWDQPLSPADARRQLVAKSVLALGVARPGWVADYFRLPKKAIGPLVQDLLKAEELIEIEVEGWPEKSLAHHQNFDLLQAAQDGDLRSTVTTLLSPFDPVVWDRTRARDLFDFAYQIEVYTPGPKRRFGYFTLPILHKGQLVGRVDAKAHRKQGLFEVKSIHLEPATRISGILIGALAQTLIACARWHQTPSVVINYSDPEQLRQALTERIRGTETDATPAEEHAG